MNERTPFGLSLSNPWKQRACGRQLFDGRASDELNPCSGRTGMGTGTGFSRRAAAVTLLAFAATCCSTAALADCMSGKPLRGVSIAGAEFNGKKLPGKANTDYVYPKPEELKYFAEAGANTVRLPFLWERLQPEPNGPLDEEQLRLMRSTIEAAREVGLCVVLDAHNYGTHRARAIAGGDVPPSAFVDFWLKVSEAFPQPSQVVLGLMNEPAHMGRRAWRATAQETVDALRAAGSRHWVFVSGAGWSGAHDWTKRDKEGDSNAEGFAKLRDPLSRTALEVHQYADSNASGTRRDCVAPDRMREIMERVTAWAKENRQRVFLGEFGVAPTPECLETLQAQLEAVREPPWIGWAYWAAGSWWGKDYPFSIQPIAGLPRGQLPLLQREWRTERFDKNDRSEADRRRRDKGEP